MDDAKIRGFADELTKEANLGKFLLGAGLLAGVGGAAALARRRKGEGVGSTLARVGKGAVGGATGGIGLSAGTAALGGVTGSQTIQEMTLPMALIGALSGGMNANDNPQDLHRAASGEMGQGQDPNQ
jgi:hypothetical protein